uniref:DUF6532 domain-containing protein n=1 Tax=Mycena chlorophos TaxID=658473 RepID=A0ABQ0L4Z4_MYCCL|nr:predicted protein [Mycena chlorophos]
MVGLDLHPRPRPLPLLPHLSPDFSLAASSKCRLQPLSLNPPAQARQQEPVNASPSMQAHQRKPVSASPSTQAHHDQRMPTARTDSLLGLCPYSVLQARGTHNQPTESARAHQLTRPSRRRRPSAFFVHSHVDLYLPAIVIHNKKVIRTEELKEDLGFACKFANRCDKGPMHPEVFNLFPASTLAMILTAIENGIDKWATGTHEDLDAHAQRRPRLLWHGQRQYQAPPIERDDGGSAEGVRVEWAGV